jgi:adenylate cyclase
MAHGDDRRKLATILALDMAGYSAQSERDQERAIAYVAALRERAAALAAVDGGHIFNTAGDGLMLEFPIASGAVRTAVTLAREAVANPQTLPRVRAGAHLGEVIIDGGDRLGHGVNVAARLMQMAPPNGVVISDAVKSQLRGEIDAEFAPCGRVRLKKMRETIFAFEHIPEASLARRQWRRWRKPLVSAASALALIAVGVLGFRALSPAAGETPSIAVLPFDNLTGDPNLDYFPQGLAIEIQSELASHLQAATVFGRTTSFQFHDAAAKAPSNVRRLIGATHIIDGSFRRDAGNARVDVELIDAHNGASLWAASYEQPFDNGLATEADIAHKVARELHIAEPDIAAPPISRAALEHYLRRTSRVDGPCSRAPTQCRAGGATKPNRRR